MTFSKSVTWTGGSLGFAIAHLGFSVTGNGVNRSGLLVGATTGGFTLTPMTFLAGEAYTFESANTLVGSGKVGSVAFDRLDFLAAPTTSAVPLPAAGWAFLSGLGLMGWVARRRRSATA